jgi:hypothetical protein
MKAMKSKAMKATKAMKAMKSKAMKAMKAMKAFDHEQAWRNHCGYMFQLARAHKVPPRVVFRMRRYRFGQDAEE